MTSRFHSTKWKRPLKVEIRNQIRSKKSLWRKYIRNKDNVSWLDYASQRNKVKILLGMILSKNRTQLLNIINQTPKNFGNMSVLKPNIQKKLVT